MVFSEISSGTLRLGSTPFCSHLLCSALYSLSFIRSTCSCCYFSLVLSFPDLFSAHDFWALVAWIPPIVDLWPIFLPWLGFTLLDLSFLLRALASAGRCSSSLLVLCYWFSKKLRSSAPLDYPHSSELRLNFAKLVAFLLIVAPRLRFEVTDLCLLQQIQWALLSWQAATRCINKHLFIISLSVLAELWSNVLSLLTPHASLGDLYTLPISFQSCSITLIEA